MRKIKFRAWHKAKHFMFVPELIGTYVMCPKTGRWENEEVEIMQFTGLYDKNDKEIYEGDIVKWGHLKNSQEHWHRIAKVELFPALQFKILFYVDSSTGDIKPTDNYIFEYGRFAYQNTEKYLEVIGNIYENPELLEEK